MLSHHFIPSSLQHIFRHLHVTIGKEHLSSLAEKHKRKARQHFVLERGVFKHFKQSKSYMLIFIVPSMHPSSTFLFFAYQKLLALHLKALIL